MTTASISNQVQAANSKLAIFLRKKEEDEALLQIGKRKPKAQITNDEKLPGGRARWSAPADFTSPTPMVDRPRTVNGSTSFHFSYITISKEAVPTVGGQPIEGKFGKQKSAALDHSKYIERDGAAEVSQGAEHAAYVERPEVIEHADAEARLADALQRSIIDTMSEKPNAEEAAILGERDAVEGVPSIFSNISDDEFERQEYWRAVERCERVPKSHEIILDPTSGAAWWAELEATDRLDPGFQHHALMVAEKYRQYLAHNEKAEQPLKKFVAEPYPVKAEQAGKIIEAMRRMPSYREQDAPFTFKSGRGGRTQIRFVAELPHELTPEDRALIVQNFVDHLSSLEERKDIDGAVRKVGLMYTAVIHAPDAHNDSRNYHLHVVAHDRPARFLEEHGLWDFEVVEHYIDPGSRKERSRFPLRQNKIGEVSQGTSKTGKEKSGIDFIPGLRSKFSKINNAVLKARGIKRQLDPRRYTEMGIDRTPTEHLGTKAAALEAIGVPTTVGKLNAIAIWGDAERAIIRQTRDANKAYANSQREFDEIGRGATAVDPQHPTLALFRQLTAERSELIKDVADDRAAILTFDHLEAKAKSRAIRTRQTCVQFLADIDTGRADNTTKMMRNAIRDRFHAAQAHIDAIDKALAPHRDGLAAAAANIEMRERRLREINEALEPIVATLEDRLQSAGVARPVTQAPAADPVIDLVKPTPAPVTLDPVADAGIPEVSAPDVPSTPLADAPVVPATDANTEIKDPVVTEEAETVPVQPATIEGLPIVEPTIGPRQDEAVEEVAPAAEVPEGLNPLRPAEVEVPVTGEVEVIRTDITQDGPEASVSGDPATAGPEDRALEVDAPESSPATSTGPAETDVPIAPVEPTAQPEEPKVDGRKKKTDPVLFELPEQEAPIKPGTAKAEYDAWDKLMKRISDQRIPIKSEKLKNGDTKFSVPSLSPADQQLLNIARFGHRTNSRLAGIEERHTNEIQRLIRWVKTSGQNSDLLILEDRTAKLGGSVKAAVRTMMKHWGSHPAVGDAIRAENARRIEVAKAEEKAKTIASPVVDIDLEDRRVQARKLYPPKDQVFTQEVAEFTELLREAAPHHLLQAAADKIHQSPAAREDINKHTVELATAYRVFVEGVDQRLAQRARDERRGR